MDVEARSVLALSRSLALDGPSGEQIRIERQIERIHIRGDDQLQQPAAHRFIRRIAERPRELAIHAQDPRILQRRERDRVRGDLEQLVVVRPLLDPVGNVHHRPEELRAVRRVLSGVRNDVNVSDRAVRQQQTMFVLDARAIPQRILEQRLDPRPVVGMDAAQRIFQGWPGSGLERGDPQRLFRAHQLARFELDAEAADTGEVLGFGQIGLAAPKRFVRFLKLIRALRNLALEALLRVLERVLRLAADRDFSLESDVLSREPLEHAVVGSRERGERSRLASRGQSLREIAVRDRGRRAAHLLHFEQ